MLEGKAVILDTDMPLKMQLHALSCAYAALDLFDVLDCSSIAAHIKKVSSFFCSIFFFFFFFFCIHGPGWQCVVGCSYGCFFTHATGTFIYFCLGRLKFLVFRGAVAKTVDQSESEK